ncbi:zinc ribbon domain-containing protein, partial [Nostoc piscinale]
FRCKKCGYECHGDYNAAVNIREDFLKLRAAVNQPIVVCPEMGT